MVNTLIKELYYKVYEEFKQVVRNAAKGEDNGIDCRFLFRYVDDDLCQDIIRVKKVYFNSYGDLCYLSDNFNGEAEASETHFYDDDCFEDLSEGNLYFETPDKFSLDFILELYDDIVNYEIPRLKEK